MPIAIGFCCNKRSLDKVEATENLVVYAVSGARCSGSRSEGCLCRVDENGMNTRGHRASSSESKLAVDQKIHVALCCLESVNVRRSVPGFE